MNTSLLRIVFLTKLIVVLLLFYGTNTAVFAENELPKLPDIGDPAAAVLPLSKEKKLSRIFVRELRAKLPLITDIEVNEYLSSIGTQLANSSASSLQFQFLLAKNPSINAFATLGGVITVNSGLWLEMSNESELAGVLAHEIAHVTQRHLARLLTEVNRFSWANALALLSIIIATTYDANLGRLGLHTSLATPLEKQLSYIRNHEREADSTAIRIMTQAGFHPEGLVSFFQHLQSLSSGSQVPEFLRTHPLTVNRLSAALNRISQYHDDYRRDSREFQYARARLYAIAQPSGVLREKTSDDVVSLYRKAVALMQLNRTYEALEILQKITTEEDNLPVELALAQAKMIQGEYPIARALLEELNALYPNRETVAYYYAMALLKSEQFSKAKNILNTVAIQPHYDPLIDKLRAEISAAEGKPWISHEYLANYLEANGQLDAALDQLKTALNKKDGGDIFLSRIKEKQKKIKALKEESKKPF